MICCTVIIIVTYPNTVEFVGRRLHYFRHLIIGFLDPRGVRYWVSCGYCVGHPRRCQSADELRPHDTGGFMHALCYS